MHRGGATTELVAALDLLATARSRDWRLERRTIAKCARQRTCGVVGAVEKCVQFDPVLVHRAKMKT